MFFILKKLNKRKMKEVLEEVRERPLFETRCLYGEDVIIIKSDSSITEKQIDRIIDIIENYYYQSERDFCDIEMEISKVIFNLEKTVRITDESNIEIVIASDI